MQNLVPNDGPGANLALWTAEAVTATSPQLAYSATSGADSKPGGTLSATGASGSVYAQTVLDVSQENALLLSVIAKASSATPTLVPFNVLFKDSNGNTIVTSTPIASAAAPTSAVHFNAVIAVPDGAVQAVVEYCTLSWSSTGGFSVIMQSPVVGAF